MRRSGFPLLGNAVGMAAVVVGVAVFSSFHAHVLPAAHNAGADCILCHTTFSVGGTVFSDTAGTSVAPGVPLLLTMDDGSLLVLDAADTNGNIVTHTPIAGRFLVSLGSVTSRTWHLLPDQGSCNRCHVRGGNCTASRLRVLPALHTRVPAENDCTHCHHFPASQSYAELATTGVLSASAVAQPPRGSQVELAGVVYPFDTTVYAGISTVRPDIFAPGFFSMFDVVLAVAARNGIALEYAYDAARKTHFLTKVGGVNGNYWYHFSYDAGTGNSSELQFRRANRWDEVLWRAGVWIRVVEGEDVDELKAEYLEEIQREATFGHRIPQVRITLNPSDYAGNPSGSGRISVTRQFQDVSVSAHNTRAAGTAAPYPQPFQPDVTTAYDVLLSLRDQGQLDLVSGVYYTRFAGNTIESHYVVALGFPGIGTAHASGRQGFTYTTENGTPARLANNADRKQHITSDILVIHAPDFATWQWTELGDPYYEAQDPMTGVVDPLIAEDHASIGRGFNLHPPYPNPANADVRISYNIFEPGDVRLSVYSVIGQEIALLSDGHEPNLGVHELRWHPGQAASGTYYIVLQRGQQRQMRKVTLIK